MFVVKHYQNGRVRVTACDSFEVATQDPRKVELFHRVAGESVIEVSPGEAVFIENLSGKTVSAIRPR